MKNGVRTDVASNLLDGKPDSGPRLNKVNDMADPTRGEIWLADMGSGKGHEQTGQRPVLVVSDDAFNSGSSGLVMVIPLTSKVAKSKNIPAHVPLVPPEGGLKTPSVLLCDQLRTISKDRLTKAPWGTATSATMAKVDNILRMLLGL
jgi:mRNA interferase MazF